MNMLNKNYTKLIRLATGILFFLAVVYMLLFLYFGVQEFFAVREELGDRFVRDVLRPYGWKSFLKHVLLPRAEPLVHNIYDPIELALFFYYLFLITPILLKVFLFLFFILDYFIRTYQLFGIYTERGTLDRAIIGEDEFDWLTIVDWYYDWLLFTLAPEYICYFKDSFDHYGYSCHFKVFYYLDEFGNSTGIIRDHRGLFYYTFISYLHCFEYFFLYMCCISALCFVFSLMFSFLAFLFIPFQQIKDDLHLLNFDPNEKRLYPEIIYDYLLNSKYKIFIDDIRDYKFLTKDFYLKYNFKTIYIYYMDYHNKTKAPDRTAFSYIEYCIMIIRLSIAFMVITHGCVFIFKCYYTFILKFEPGEAFLPLTFEEPLLSYTQHLLFFSCIIVQILYVWFIVQLSPFDDIKMRFLLFLNSFFDKLLDYFPWSISWFSFFFILNKLIRFLKYLYLMSRKVNLLNPISLFNVLIRYPLLVCYYSKISMWSLSRKELLNNPEFQFDYNLFRLEIFNVLENYEAYLRENASYLYRYRVVIFRKYEERYNEEQKIIASGGILKKKNILQKFLYYICMPMDYDVLKYEQTLIQIKEKDAAIKLKQSTAIMAKCANIKEFIIRYRAFRKQQNQEYEKELSYLASKIFDRIYIHCEMRIMFELMSIKARYDNVVNVLFYIDTEIKEREKISEITKEIPFFFVVEYLHKYFYPLEYMSKPYSSTFMEYLEKQNIVDALERLELEEEGKEVIPDNPTMHFYDWINDYIENTTNYNNERKTLLKARASKTWWIFSKISLIHKFIHYFYSLYCSFIDFKYRMQCLKMKEYLYYPSAKDIEVWNAREKERLDFLVYKKLLKKQNVDSVFRKMYKLTIECGKIFFYLKKQKTFDEVEGGLTMRLIAQDFKNFFSDYIKIKYKKNKEKKF